MFRSLIQRFFACLTRLDTRVYDRIKNPSVSEGALSYPEHGPEGQVLTHEFSFISWEEKCTGESDTCEAFKKKFFLITLRLKKSKPPSS